MAKRLYPHKRVRYWYAYDLDEICALFSDLGLHIQTVRAWVNKNGLKTIDASRPILIYGYDLIAYLKAQNDKGKCQTEFNKLYCMKCKDQRPAFQNKIALELKNGFLKACGHCRECKSKMYKIYDCSIPAVKTHLSTQDKKQPNESGYGTMCGDLFDD